MDYPDWPHLRTGTLAIHRLTQGRTSSSLAAKLRDQGAYFETRSWTEEWTHGGHSAAMTFWTRPLHAMTDAFFVLEAR